MLILNNQIIITYSKTVLTMFEDILYLVFRIFLIAWLGSFVIIGIFFLIRAYQLNLKNLIFGGTGFLMAAISQVGKQFFGFNLAITRVLLAISFVLVIIFTNTTFHRDKQSNLPKLIIILGLTLSSIVSVLSYLEMSASSPLIFYLNVSSDTLLRVISFGWLAWSSYSVYREIKNQDMELWIKARYKILFIVSFIFSFHNVPFFFQPWNISFGDSSNLSSFIVFGAISLFGLTFAIGFSLTWFMPKRFKIFFNKGYQPKEDRNYTEEELMTLIRKQMSEGDPNTNN